MKKGQITLFIISGIVILIIIALSISITKINSLHLKTNSLDTTPIRQFTEKCMEITLLDALKDSGLKEQEIEQKVSDNFDNCLQEYSSLSQYDRITTEQERSEIKITNTSIIYNLKYIVNVESANSKASISDFSIDLPLSQEIKLDGTKKIVSSSDQAFKLIILEGTEAYDKNGKEIDTITITVKEIEDYEAPLGKEVGHFVYLLEPHGATFNPPLEVKYLYENISSNENKLRLTYFMHEPKNWIKYEKQRVDTYNDFIYAQIPHFTEVAPIEEEDEAKDSEYTATTCDNGQKLLHTPTSWCETDCNTGTDCPEGEINCDCYSGCAPGDISRCKSQIEMGTGPIDGNYIGGGSGAALNGKYHHTQTNGPDGGQSLVLCPGDNTIFDSCNAGSVKIPYHGRDEGRISYWNMKSYSYQSIICKKGGQTYTFPITKGGRGLKYGSC